MTDHAELPHGEPGEDAHHGHGVHLPDPSMWPFIVGFAALALGLALVWWSRDRDSEIAGPLLGAAAVATIVAACGWAYEDGRMKKKAEEGTLTEPRNARYTQVITFAVPEGQLGEARSNGGVLNILESADSRVRDLDGFQDLRLILTPADTGPSQVLLETTWSDRETLGTYEESRRTLLDILTAHPEQVVPGSVQVFDMEVVRDTKDVAFKFGLGTAFALIGSLLVGGFIIGAGLNLFGEEQATAGEGPPPASADPYEVLARDNTFPDDTLEAPPNTQATFTLVNRGRSPHNVHFLQSRGGETLAEGAEGEIVNGGESVEVTFTTPGPGEYFFQCDVHPNDMTGTFTVREGATPPGGSAPPAASPTGSTTPTTG